MIVIQPNGRWVVGFIGIIVFIAGIFLLVILAGAGQHHVSAVTSSQSRTATSSIPADRTVDSAAVAVVRAYFGAINQHNYVKAWALGGKNTGALSYRNFANEFKTTAHDTVIIVSVTGNIVTARLTARQTDGTIKTFEGTYTVSGGAITQFNVLRIS